ncbi:MAG: prolyl oligopeptidase family serine peptidase [Bacteroidales bacterium]|nr:prolyl oligopeptidase family serine peptidase [Bacteroidales bacterium]
MDSIDKRVKPVRCNLKIGQILLATTLFLLVGSLSFAQKEITVQDVLKWNRITESVISDNGSYIAVKMEPWKGSSTVKLYNNKGKELFSADSSSNVQFAGGSDFLVFKKQGKKTSSLHTYSIKNRESTIIDSVKTFNLSKSNNSILIAHKQDSTLVVGTLGSALHSLSRKVGAYTVSENENAILFFEKSDLVKNSNVSSKGNSKVIKYFFEDISNLKKNSFLREAVVDTLWSGSDSVSLLALSEDGAIASFVANNKLYVKEQLEKLNEIASGVSKKRELKFSQDGSKLYFGLEREKPKKDTTISKEDFPEVNIWNWNEDVQFTVQLANKERDLNASDLAVYTFEKESWFQITNDFVTHTLLVEKGNSPLVIALSDKNYSLERMWTGRSKFDVHIFDTYLERGLFALKGVDGMPRVSPAGKFLFWYSAPDSAWFTYSLERSEKIKITSPNEIAAFNQTNDVPDWPSSYSFAGWTEDDKQILIYDRYNIWAVDPFGKSKPVNLTVNGLEKKTSYRYIQTNPLEEFIDLSSPLLLSGFDNTTKGYGYYSAKGLDGTVAPEFLYGGEFMLNTPIKAKESHSYIFTKETFEEFPDILFTNNNFKKVTAITQANPQQKNFIWGTARLIKWTSHDGIELEGVLYLPENFNPSIKYPMVVNFYEKNSHNLYSHRIPEAHRSTIDYHTYNSSGYVIFNPDVVYKDGYPGESAFNAVMPGITKVIEMGFVNPKKIGAQGHSWGGYQVAYLATRTNLFAAIESGAPVVNMFSAYGGIRWGTGLNRSFQYEHQQSRIGATPWESPLRYMENSPLFTMDKVTSPILIMHNDNDGHVPWYQGIEYFVALKRLRKPVWMLNYTGEIHWPQKMKNKVDFQIRMKQFFDHYLKDAPAPKWMDQGISAIELDAQTGY